ncbi:NADH-quinone oxidoreductase subunit NuoF [Syntrophomonas wolfei]|uniref:NADH dehydrogenase (Quinone) n=1 Tax=Syntrophomonas wolfei subsp. wolfei (strain DSM 2245B / Goettingen) TaxID=335541 RepID=Q0AWA5_SYNWW|nr:NADH-quinone oxidoreductase subunit NuoF [Syntrophomonas wolfei]ABI68999.1 NADH dehydrogenase (quinone) [Syntrophomonas wolfei subsp. wolfei str. Goettingen G311]
MTTMNKSLIHLLLVCCGTGCVANGAREVYQALKDNLTSDDKAVLAATTSARATGCHGLCAQGPFVRILPEDITYCRVKAADIPEIVEKTLKQGEVVKRLLFRDRQKKTLVQGQNDIPFYQRQTRVALRNVGLIDPSSLQDYLERGGYRTLEKSLLDMRPEQVIEEIIKSGLRGRGGGGFPTGLKWKACAATPAQPRYIICNGDEGDPGAFMDESIMEGDPHSVLEGMIIAAYAVGASNGFIYVRDEYAQSVASLRKAIEEAENHGFLGENILGSALSFNIEIVRGGGAFVCGEETALIASIEGNVGEPRDKYVFPSEKGLWGQPTIINNVETWANIPVIMERGASWFTSLGTEGSKGTKVFSLVGKVANTGLVEVPMGTTLREIIFDIGGGVPKGRSFKAVQTGGPSGGCIPSELLDLKVDFDSLSQAGSMMGSGGLIVMDDRTCMVEVVRYYLSFLAGESCGKCVPCREGIKCLLEILTRICHGQGEIGDIALLEDIAETMQQASLCALGRTASNPVLSTLRYFREEYLEHIEGQRCPAGICRELSEFWIDPVICTGCGLCLPRCPVEGIKGEKKQAHWIESDKCIRCGECIDSCSFQAIKVK